MSTSMFQGMREDDKPSSRVLRPPGGASSNIFGEAEPVVQRPRAQQKQPTCDIFGNEIRSPVSSQPKQEEFSQDRLAGDSAAENMPPPAVETPPAPAPRSEPAQAPALDPPSGKGGNRRNQTSLDLSQPERPGTAGITPCRKRFFENEGRDGEGDDEEDEEQKKEEEKRKAEAASLAPVTNVRNIAKPPRGAYNPITMQDNPDFFDGARNPSKISDPNRGRGQYNPITGEEYSGSRMERKRRPLFPQRPKSNASPRNRQPPGGASSITF